MTFLPTFVILAESSWEVVRCSTWWLGMWRTMVSLGPRLHIIAESWNIIRWFS